MSKDYKAKPRASAKAKSGSSLLVGLLLGLVLGLVVALGVAWYINKMPSPFTPRAAPPSPPAKMEAPKGLPVQQPQQAAKPEEKAPGKAEDEPRFTFYKTLPGGEEAPPGKSAKDAKSTPGAKETFFLQAGAFQNAPDADNLKATLALLGFEAAIETTTLPDKGVWHRVRVGPYTSVEELNRARDALKQNGVQTTLVKAREPER
ncbi:MAG TPA: SPOR domain-containing protein [Burkholderiales bacterium]|nr:SPOR domain-containing protein [Burkholderiales bacterium]